MNKIIEHSRSITIRNANPELQKYGFATHVLNGGLLCGNHCLWCPNPALMRTQDHFKSLGMSSVEAFQKELVIIDPNTPDRLLTEIPEIGLSSQDKVLLGRSFDLWSREALKFDLGRRCMETLLLNSSCKIRILTKSAAVKKDFDLLTKFKDRVELSLPLPTASSKSYLVNFLEPKASSLQDRFESLIEARQKGIQVFGMLSPCFPGLINSKDDLAELFETLLLLNPTGLWVETANLRHVDLADFVKALQDQGEHAMAKSIGSSKDKITYRIYLVNLLQNIIEVSNKLNCLNFVQLLIPVNGSAFVRHLYTKFADAKNRNI